MANVTKTVSFKVNPALVHRAIPGEHHEDREPGNPKYDRIMTKSKRRGFKPKTITIDVNGQGQAHIADGNTHAAVGAALGVKKMKAQIRYHDGSENLLSAKKLKKKLAVRHMAEGGSAWVAFEPTQVKSTMNRGTFDPNDPHLNKARGGLVEKYGLAT